MSRSCDGCTKCCEGFLSGEAKGIRFYEGRPCHFKGCTDCTIYPERPQLCKDFSCVWKDDKDSLIPEWFFPKVSNVLITRRSYAEGKDYLQVSEAGATLGAKYLSWLIVYHLGGGLPLAYQIEGGWNYLGPKDFIEHQMTTGAGA